MHVRGLLWLIVLLAFSMPPTIGHGKTDAMAHAVPPVAAVALGDCPQHAPPPDPCPAKGTAKHAAGECCPTMAIGVAVLPTAAASWSRPAVHDLTQTVVSRLSGLLFTKDPPPPRA